MRLIDFFDRGVALNPDGICLQDDLVARSYAEMQTRTFRLANALAAEGFGKGHMAGLYSPNCVSGFEAMLGMMRAGAIWVPVNAKNGVEENAYILDNTDVEILFYHSSFEPVLDRIKASCPKISRFICLDREGEAGPAMEDWLAAADDGDPDVALAADDLVSILFTATPDLHCAFPAAAARELGLVDVPLICAQELDIAGALPRAVRALVHAETDLPRDEIAHVYLRGAEVLRQDLAQ